ncbi:alpha/beta fold hydrolase [Deinococcus planocerae]|uniref:alpha/beta fold hydrolase n=1 Tax=Deinococcus planocerae TaxID=1737569 RepID=UPI000C7EB708|nr:alpha/beta hydrolase [Deinococcus planocerae]
MTSHQTERGRGAALGRTLGLSALPLAAWLGWTVYSRLRIPHDLTPPPALDAERRTLGGRAGPVNAYVAGSGAPLLLVHSVNAAASAYEVRPLFEHYRASRRVYALDLPGFGFSRRGGREYTPRLMTDALHDVLDEIALESGEERVDALALSLGGEFLARAASERPERFRSVTLVTPTGFGKSEQFYGGLGSTRGSAALKRAYEHPLLGQPFYDLLASVPSLRFFLALTFGSFAAVDEGLLRYDYPTSHVPGARHAPFAFISGTLFSADIDRVYEALTVPVWLAYGTRDRFTDFGDLSNVERRPNWTFDRFETGALAYFEQPGPFISAYDAFLRRAGAN